MRQTILRGAFGGLTALAMLAGAGARAAADPPAAPSAAAPSAPPATGAAPPAIMIAPPPTAASGMSAGKAPAMTGPLIAGICLISQDGVIARSKVGQAATTRLKDMRDKAQTELGAEQTRLQTRMRALAEKRASLPPMQFDAQEKALAQRQQALQTEAQERGRQLETAKTRTLNDLLQQAEPFVEKAYAAHGCGLLFAREAVLSGNLGNDLTAEVIAALDAAPTAPAPATAPKTAK